MQSFDDRTPLGDLLDRCQLGMSLVITRHGLPVARLIPYSRPRDPADVARAVRKLRSLRKGPKLPRGMTIKDLIEEGRS